jgi:glutaredoxin
MGFVVPLLLFVFLPALLTVEAQMYRWVDDGGKVHYSDQAPSSGAKNVQKQTMSAGQGPAAGFPYALQLSVRNFPVKLYTAEACGEPCAQARELLDKRGVPYNEVSVTAAASAAQLKELSGGNTVPVMTVGREVYKGFESGTYKAALDSAGYPASSQLPPGVQAKQPIIKPSPKTSAATAAAGGASATAEPGAVTPPN